MWSGTVHAWERVSSTRLQLDFDNQQPLCCIPSCSFRHNLHPAGHAMPYGVQYIASQICSILAIALLQMVLPGFLSRVSACCDVQKGSLDGALRGIAPPGDGPPRLDWRLRVRLAAACADALSYLQLQPPQVSLLAYMWLLKASATWGLYLRQELGKEISLSQPQAKVALCGSCQCTIHCLSLLNCSNLLQPDRQLHPQGLARAHQQLSSEYLKSCCWRYWQTASVSRTASDTPLHSAAPELPKHASEVAANRTAMPID